MKGVFGAITAALLRKVQSFLAEVKALVAEVTAVEHKLVAEAEAEIKAIETKVGTEVETLRNDLVERISKL